MYGTDNVKSINTGFPADGTDFFGSDKEYTAAVFSVKRYSGLGDAYGLNAVYAVNSAIDSWMRENIFGDEYFSFYENNCYAAVLNGTAEDCRIRLENYFRSVTQSLISDKRHIKISFVCGIYRILPEDRELAAVFGKAASAMKTANSISGFTDIVEYTEEILRKEQRWKKIERDLYKAVRNKELVIEIQPKFSFETGKCVSAEALVRWEHPELGRLVPDEFIPIAEQTGDIIDIDMYVLETVCSHMRRWMDRGVNPVPVAVNQSRLHIADPDYVESVFAVMQEYDVWPSLIELETTESIAFNDYEAVAGILKKLHSIGFILSMDDFGSGYSSIHMLSELEYDVLKLDHKIVQNNKNKQRNTALLRHVIAMAHELNMTVVAEGVETEEQAKTLKSLGCDLAQGFLYSYPLTIEKFDADIFGLIDAY